MVLLSAALAGTSSWLLVPPKPVAGHPVLDVRLGVVRSDTTPHPYVCIQGTPLDRISLEGCGTGAGFLYPASDEPDMAHFRARAAVAREQFGRLGVEAAVGAGLAEIDRGGDAPGFTVAGTPNEAAGPEATLSATGRAWVHPRAYVIVDVTGGVAWIPAAPEVVGQEGPWVPFAALSAGLGF